VESRGSEKERPDDGQLEGSGDAGDAPHGRRFGGNLKPRSALLLFPSGMLSWTLVLARQRPEKDITQRGAMDGECHVL
jgi:hypothetical protein